MNIQGSVAPGFESVKTLFEQNMNDLAEDKAQLCIYHQGNKVVDLWATRGKAENFSPDFLINIWSSGKSFEALALAHLVDKGLLRYDEKISSYWPEFAKHGKGDIKVEDLLRHESGLHNLNHAFRLNQFLPEKLKQNSVGKVIENAYADLPDNLKYRRNYHALSRGWLANEIFRRVDPKGRTMGEYLKEEISGPLNADVYVGVPKEALKRIRSLKVLGFFTHLRESFKSKENGRRVIQSHVDLYKNIRALMTGMWRIWRYRFSELFKFGKKKASSQYKKPFTLPRPPFSGINPFKDGFSIFNIITGGVMAQGESSSFAAKCSARGLAKTAAMLAAGGSFEGKQYLGTRAWDSLHDKVVTKELGPLGPTHFSQGGVNLFQLIEGEKHSAIDLSANKGRDGFWGWMGMGGSIFQWHRELDIGFAFVPNMMHMLDGFNERGKIYQVEVVRCVKGLEYNELNRSKSMTMSAKVATMK